jgi:hypothetical protein
MGAGYSVTPGYDSLECHRYNVCDFEIRTSISESG